MKNKIVILGDWIADVYINVNNIAQNQEIINHDSLKGYYKDINVYAGGTGFLLENLLKCYIDDKNDNFNILYLLPEYHNSKNINDTIFTWFDLSKVYDMSVRYIYEKYNNRNISIIKMQPIDYIHDIIKPTVKTRFFSKKEKEIFFRFDYDNNIRMKNINCNGVFSRDGNNILLLIDYNKGYFTKESINSLFKYIKSNNIKIDKLFVNTKPCNVKLYIEFFRYLRKNATSIIIQLNESEFAPVKEIVLNEDYAEYVIVTRGDKDIHFYRNKLTKNNPIKIELKHVIKDIHTTSGAGDAFFAHIIYYNIKTNNKFLFESINLTIDNIHNRIKWLNNRLFVQ